MTIHKPSNREAKCCPTHDLKACHSRESSEHQHNSCCDKLLRVRIQLNHVCIRAPISADAVVLNFADKVSTRRWPEHRPFVASMLVDMVSADYGPSGRVPLQRGTDYNVFCLLLKADKTCILVLSEDRFRKAGHKTTKDR